MSCVCMFTSAKGQTGVSYCENGVRYAVVQRDASAVNTSPAMVKRMSIVRRSSPGGARSTGRYEFLFCGVHVVPLVLCMASCWLPARRVKPDISAALCTFKFCSVVVTQCYTTIPLPSANSCISPTTHYMLKELTVEEHSKLVRTIYRFYVETELLLEYSVLMFKTYDTRRS